MAFSRTTNKPEIVDILRRYMLSPDRQRAPFLVAIFVRGGSDWNGEKVTPGGLIIEGARPLSSCVDADGGRQFALTNGDSNYTRPIGTVSIEDVEYIEEL